GSLPAPRETPALAGREGGRDQKFEAPVAVKQRRMRAVELETFFGGDEHRDLRAVLAGIEDLFHLVIVGAEQDLRLAVERALARQQIVAVDARRRVEAAEGVEGLRVG